MSDAILELTAEKVSDLILETQADIHTAQIKKEEVSEAELELMQEQLEFLNNAFEALCLRIELRRG